MCFLKLYQVLVARYDRQALGCSYYYILGSSELNAIANLYEAVEDNLKPSGFLGEYSVPDYTCAVEL